MLTDEPGGQRGDRQRPDAHARHGDAESDGSPTLEPTSDGADHRDVRAGGPDAGADSVREARYPERRRHGGEDKADAHDGGARE